MAKKRPQSHMVIIRDTREQNGYTFGFLPQDQVKVAALPTGDYSIEGLEDQVTIERKSLADAFGTIGGQRKRFQRELERMTSFKYAAVVIEAGWADRPVFGALLALAADGAWAERAEAVTFCLPAADAFMRACRPYGLRCETTFRRDGGAMVRMINVPSALGKLAPLLADRAGGAGQLNIVTNLDAAALSWHRGKVTRSPVPLAGAPTARLPQWAVAQLLYGYADAADLHAEGILKAPQQTVGLLAALFPPTEHYHYRTDQF